MHVRKKQRSLLSEGLSDEVCDANKAWAASAQGAVDTAAHCGCATTPVPAEAAGLRARVQRDTNRTPASTFAAFASRRWSTRNDLADEQI